MPTTDDVFQKVRVTRSDRVKQKARVKRLNPLYDAFGIPASERDEERDEMFLDVYESYRNDAD